MLNIEADVATINELSRVMSINEDIVRNMTLIKTSDFDNKSELFVCTNAKDYKTAKAASKEVEGKFDAILEQFKFDN
jgi:ribosomal protein S6